MRQILENYDSHSLITNSSVQELLKALQQLCKMASRRNASHSHTIQRIDIREHIRTKILTEKSNQWLQHARQLYNNHNYKEAQEEVQRALLLTPNNEEAKAFLEEIQKQLSSVDTVQTAVTTSHDEEKVYSHSVELKTIVSAADKVVACISYVEYHKANKNYTEALRYAKRGLKYDAENKVLLQFIDELEALVGDTERVDEY